MSAKPKAYLQFSIDVDCPECEESFDLCDDKNDYDQRITDQIFNNQWADLKGAEVTCTHCGYEFEIEEVTY